MIELLALEGDDTGQRFTFDGHEMVIGRRAPEADGESSVGLRGLQLRDETVSARQATLRRVGGSIVIEHDRRATNPTRVNGRDIGSQRLEVGDRIEMGHVVLEVHMRSGLSISGLTEMWSSAHPNAAATGGAPGKAGLPAEVSPASASANARVKVSPVSTSATAPTEVSPVSASATAPTAAGPDAPANAVVPQLGVLHVEAGRSLLDASEFTIWAGRTKLGRATDCDVRIHEVGVSRHHAELRYDAGVLKLVHLSRVNSTLLGGVPVEGEAVLSDGDTIGLADRVVLRVELETVGGEELSDSTTENRGGSLRGEMEAKIERDRSIEDRFAVEGSFLDVDVVDSYGMKAEASAPEHIIVSFERFRAFVEGVVDEHGGIVLNSNGDELMCFFERTVDAVRAGWAVLERRPAFNVAENLLGRDFSFRLGVHTGRSLVDFDRGVAYSAVLDLAGHLQKRADVNGLVVSDETLAGLTGLADSDETPVGELPFEELGRLERENVVIHRMLGPLPPDLDDAAPGDRE